jgi:pimeloyl-ACP methyl ester carboxylesterase
MDIRRHVATVADRQVHYRRMGEGPVVILLHQSPRSGLEMVPTMRRMALNHTVIAPDTPGNGLSTPLAIERPTMGDYADALAAFLTEIGVDKALVYGFHTGAMCAFELARRHPDRVACAVVNGYVHPGAEERDDLLAHYFVPFVPDWSGAHLVWAWARMREQYVFYPWYKKSAAARIAIPEPSLATTQADVLDLLCAGDHYRGPYRAAFTGDLETAASEIAAPTLIMTMKPDWPLRPHLAHMAPPSPSVTVAEPDTMVEAMALLDAAFAAHRDEADASPPLAPTRPGEHGGWQRFVALPGGDLLVRTWGQGSALPPLVLLHDVGRSSADMADVAEGPSRERLVVAFDLPGCGDSDGFADAVTPQAQAAIVAEAIAAMGLPACAIAGFGTAGPVAIDLARLLPGEAPVHAARPEAARTPMGPAEDGGLHLYRHWLAERRAILFAPGGSDGDDEAALDPARLHRIVLDALKGQPAAAAIIAAARAYDFEAGAAMLGESRLVRLPDGPGAKAALAAHLAAMEPA